MKEIAQRLRHACRCLHPAARAKRGHRKTSLPLWKRALYQALDTRSDFYHDFYLGLAAEVHGLQKDLHEVQKSLRELDELSQHVIEIRTQLASLERGTQEKL